MKKRGEALPKILFAVAAISVLAVWPAAVQAQGRRIRIQPVPAEPGDEDIPPGNFATPERSVLQALSRAQKVLKENRYGEALEVLSQILASNEDFFYQPDRKVPIYKSLKAEAQQLLGQMSQEGLDLYEARSGGEARDKLNRAVAAGDAAGLAEISARLFHTQAGYEATYLLALDQMDHGAPLAGALTLKRLREAGSAVAAFEPGLSLTQAACYYQAGMPDDCKRVLVDLKHRLGQTPRGPASLQLAGREVPWFDEDKDAAAWLAKLTGLQRMAAAVETDRWAMFRGDPARNASASGGAPLLNYRWRVNVSFDPNLQDALVKQEAVYREQRAAQRLAVFPALHPLAVGNVVLMRTTTKLLAIDFQTGKLLWERDEDETPAEPAPYRMNGIVFGGQFNNMNLSQPALYGQRIWEDATYGTLSSDGNLVFVIEELPLGMTAAVQNFGGMVVGGGRNDPSIKGPSNVLAACNIRTGKLEWKLGGQDSLRQSDAFFLGPPLPLRGQLFVMAEIKDEIRLLALDGATGDLLWSQQLAMVESSVTMDPIRRMAGVSPSYSDGVLVCPTGAGCVVAVDLANRSLLWGYIYPRPGDMATAPQVVNAAVRRAQLRQMQMMNANGSRWVDGSATIVNGRVLLTPPEADGLYCLNLADGKPAWAAKPRVERNERGELFEHYYVACVHQGLVVLVGRNTIDAVKLDDGSRVWSCPTSNSSSTGAMVCGRGFYAGGQYFLPLTSGEIATIDLESGKIVGSAKPRGGRSDVPGNLICHRGRVLSQGLVRLESFLQADFARDEVARRLAANPDDVDGLALRGELFLDAGKPAEAVADFRRAYGVDNRLEKKSDSHGRIRELLRDALLAGLHDDFAAHRSLAGDLEPLLDDSAQRADFYRCMASGLHRAGQLREAVEYYLKLVDLEEARPGALGTSGLEKIDDTYLARRDCWVQARLSALRSESQSTGQNPNGKLAGGEVAAEIDRAVQQRLEEAVADPNVDRLKRFLAFFGNLPQAAPARAELLKRLVQAGGTLEAELLMAAAVPASTGDSGTDRKAQAALLAEMAEINFHAGRVSDAAACFRQLQREFPDVSCHTTPEGVPLTSAQWLAAFPGGDELRRRVNPSAGTLSGAVYSGSGSAWPVGEVEASKPEITNPNGINNRMRYDMHWGGPSGPFFSDYNLGMEGNQQEISLCDGLGNLQKPMRLVSDDENGRAYGIGYNPNTTVARSCGHLLLVAQGTKILALDPWGASSAAATPGRTTKILWSQDLLDPTTDNAGNTIYINNGVVRDMRADPFGPVNARYVSFLRKRSLVVVDPLTGDPLWTRQDLPPGSDVFGDEQYLFVLPPNSDEASVYRASEGQLLGTRKVPRPKNGPQYPSGYRYSNYDAGGSAALSNFGFGFFGRSIITWQPGSDNNGRVLGLFDPWQQKAVWPSRKFPSVAFVSLVGSEAVGVLEPSGHFVLVALDDGRTIADLQLQIRPQFTVTDFVVTRMGDQYIVLTNDNRDLSNGNPGQVQQTQVQPPQGLFCYPVQRARIYAVDLKGGLAWQAPVDVDHKQFLLNQPGRLPVLVFAVFHYEVNAAQAPTLRSSLVAVDRRNGNIVYDQDTVGQMRGTMGVEIRGDAEAKTVRVAAGNETLNLLFTDKPVRTMVRQSLGVKKPAGRLGEALLDAVEGAAGLK